MLPFVRVRGQCVGADPLGTGPGMSTVTRAMDGSAAIAKRWRNLPGLHRTRVLGLLSPKPSNVLFSMLPFFLSPCGMWHRRPADLELGPASRLRFRAVRSSAAQVGTAGRRPVGSFDWALGTQVRNTRRSARRHGVRIIRVPTARLCARVKAVTRVPDRDARSTRRVLPTSTSSPSVEPGLIARTDPKSMWRR